MSTLNKVWTDVIDGKYRLSVTSEGDPYKGVLEIHLDGRSIFKKNVTVSYGARFGADLYDIEEWFKECLSFIDGLNGVVKKPNPKVSGIDHRHIPLETLNRSVGYSGDLEKMVSKNSYISNKANLLLIEKPS